MSRLSLRALTSQSPCPRCVPDVLPSKCGANLTSAQVQRQGMRLNNPLQRSDQRSLWMWLRAQPKIILDQEWLHRSRKRNVDGPDQPFPWLVSQRLRYVLPSLFDWRYYHRKDNLCRQVHRCSDRKQMWRRIQIARRGSMVPSRNLTLGVRLKPIKMCEHEVD